MTVFVCGRAGTEVMLTMMPVVPAARMLARVPTLIVIGLRW
jgi:hypothetical protein